MGLGWIRISKDLPRHAKSRALARALGDKRAWTYLVDLFSYCGDYAQDGVFQAQDAQAAIEDACGWAGEPGAFFNAALDVGFLDRREDGSVYVHDWMEHNGEAIAKARADAERKRGERHSTERRAPVHGQSTERRARGEVDENENENRKEEKHMSAGADAPEALQAAWNGHPQLPQWRELTPKRRKAAAARLAERGLDGPGGMGEVVARIAASGFCTGSGSTGWRASPDWLLKPDTPAMVLEGKYDDRTPPRPRVAPELLVGKGGDGPPAPVDPDSWLITEPLPDEKEWRNALPKTIPG